MSSLNVSNAALSIKPKNWKMIITVQSGLMEVVNVGVTILSVLPSSDSSNHREVESKTDTRSVFSTISETCRRFTILTEP